MKKSRTQQALDLLRANPGMSQYQACKALGLDQSVVSRAVRREQAKTEQLTQSGARYE